MSKCEDIIERFELLEGKLIGADKSLDGLLKNAKKHLYSDNIEFKPIDKTSWSVHNKDGELVQYIVTLKKGRYRLEQSGKEPAKKSKAWGDGDDKGTITNIEKDGDIFIITIAGSKDEYIAHTKSKYKKGDKVDFRYNSYGFAQIK